MNDNDALKIFILPTQNDKFESRLKIACTELAKITHILSLELEIALQEVEINEVGCQDWGKIRTVSCPENDETMMFSFLASLMHLKLPENCWMEFTKLFRENLSSLYMEHKICQSLQERCGHRFGNDFQECGLCKRIRRENPWQAFPLLTKDKPGEDVREKTELLRSLKEIGYNIHGTHFEINTHVYDEGKPSLLTAIRLGNMSWIRAFVAVGARFIVENKRDDTDTTGFITVMDYALMHAPKKDLYTILRFFSRNAAVPITEETKRLMGKEVLGTVTRNECDFLQWLLDLDLLPKEPDELKSLIYQAAGLSHYKCLKVSLLPQKLLLGALQQFKGLQ